MTVLDNVQDRAADCAARPDSGNACSTPRVSPEGASARGAGVCAPGESLGLARFADVYAAGLPYGFQRKLEIARALATDPAVLLLDEPAAGMNAQETAEIDRASFVPFMSVSA